MLPGPFFHVSHCQKQQKQQKNKTLLLRGWAATYNVSQIVCCTCIPEVMWKCTFGTKNKNRIRMREMDSNTRDNILAGLLVQLDDDHYHPLAVTYHDDDDDDDV